MMANMQNFEKMIIILREKSLCKFVIAVSREIACFSMLKKFPNHIYKTHADWLKQFYSPWESKRYKIKSQNSQI